MERMTLCRSVMYNQLRVRRSSGWPIDLQQAGVVEMRRGLGNNNPFPQEDGQTTLFGMGEARRQQTN